MNDEATQPSTGERPPIRLLFVDDEPALVQLAQSKLGRMGYEITGMTSSREALERVQEDPTRFDIIVSDMNMPEHSGDQLVRLIHRLRPDLPVILISGYDHRISSLDAQHLNIVAFLFMPFRMEELDMRIRSMVLR